MEFISIICKKKLKVKWRREKKSDSCGHVHKRCFFSSERRKRCRMFWNVEICIYKDFKVFWFFPSKSHCMTVTAHVMTICIFFIYVNYIFFVFFLYIYIYIYYILLFFTPSLICFFFKSTISHSTQLSFSKTKQKTANNFCILLIL